MSDSTMTRREVDQFVAGLLARGHSAGWIGLELTTLGTGMLSRILGSKEMAEHFRRLADQFEKGTERIHSDNGYSSMG